MGFTHGMPLVRSPGQTHEEARRERQILNMRSLRLKKKGVALEPNSAPPTFPQAQPAKKNNILDLVHLRG